MPVNCLAALEEFDSGLEFESYNMINCHNIVDELPVESDLAAALPHFAELGESERAAIRERINSRLAAKLAAFALRMGAMALRERSVAKLRSGAIALTLDADVLDYRDVYRTLAVLCDAASRISAPFDEMMEQVAHHATSERASIINGYLLGPDYMRSIKSMGISLRDTAAGPMYETRRF